jgi:hypothetical protein
MSGELGSKTIHPLRKPYHYALLATIGALGIGLVVLTSVFFGIESPRLVANGIVSVSLGVFLLTLLVFHASEKNKDEFLQKGAIRTAITISFTVAYLMLLAYSLIANELGISFENKVLENFYLVYISIIGFYFGTTSLEKVSDTLRKTQ